MMGEQPVEYRYSRNGESARYLITLPEQMENQPYAKLRWKYYYTGTQKRTRNRDGYIIRIDNISITPGVTSTALKSPTRQFQADVTL